MADSDRMIVYRGISMIQGWPDRIKAAQGESTYRIAGVDVGRVRYSDEKSDWNADKLPCHDCGVFKGEFHVKGCDVEECPQCNGQVGGCGCDYEEASEQL
jgi:hypothetical protein